MPTLNPKRFTPNSAHERQTLVEYLLQKYGLRTDETEYVCHGVLRFEASVNIVLFNNFDALGRIG
jgi:hypothetical protein